jgi:hypothetical protein
MVAFEVSRGLWLDESAALADTVRLFDISNKRIRIGQDCA